MREESLILSFGILYLQILAAAMPLTFIQSWYLFISSAGTVLMSTPNFLKWNNLWNNIIMIISGSPAENYSNQFNILGQN